MHFHWNYLGKTFPLTLNTGSKLIYFFFTSCTSKWSKSREATGDEVQVSWSSTSQQAGHMIQVKQRHGILKKQDYRKLKDSGGSKHFTTLLQVISLIWTHFLEHETTSWVSISLKIAQTSSWKHMNFLSDIEVCSLVISFLWDNMAARYIWMEEETGYYIIDDEKRILTLLWRRTLTVQLQPHQQTRSNVVHLCPAGTVAFVLRKAIMETQLHSEEICFYPGNDVIIDSKRCFPLLTK